MTDERLKTLRDGIDVRLRYIDDPVWTSTAALELLDHVEELKQQVSDLSAWRNSVSMAVKNLPEFHTGHWTGDKEGWGFHFEVISWMIRELARLRAGDLTAEEFQSLCHNLHLKDKPCTRAEFEAACRKCADELFAPKPGYDHSARTEKHFEPGLGFCLCVHCTKLPFSAVSGV